MKRVDWILELDQYLTKYSFANVVGKDFDCAPVRELCEKLNTAEPEKYNFDTSLEDHEFMVSISKFFKDLVGM